MPPVRRRTDLLLVALLVPAVLILVVRAQASPGILIEPREPLPGVDQVRVQVAGAVLQPGVVTVAPGARVADAVALAGGVTSDADTTAVNMARRVVDEDQIVVPRLGDSTASALVDLNRASAKELEALPGVGAVTAQRIMDARAARPFASSDNLVARKLVSARVYAGIRDLVATP